MKHIILLAFGILLSSAAAEATVTTFTNSTDFHVANPDAVLIENFENSDPAVRDTHLPSYEGPNGLIAFLGLPSVPFEPHVTVASPGYPNFGAGMSPTTSVILTSSNLENFIGVLQVPVTSLGFDVFLNDSPSTLSFFNGDTLLATFMYDTPPVLGQNLAFAGIFSSEGVTSFHWQTTADTNTGVDNIYAGPIPNALPGVPEPATWAMMLLGFGTIGVAMRQKKNAIKLPAVRPRI